MSCRVKLMKPEHYANQERRRAELHHERGHLAMSARHRQWRFELRDNALARAERVLNEA